MKQLSFVGAGNMAAAIIKGIAGGKLREKYRLSAYDIDQEKVEALSSYGVRYEDDVKAMVAGSDLILLAVKPQMIDEALSSLKGAVSSDTVVISIVTGISSAYIQNGLGFDAKVVTVMPNTPLLIGCGATALAKASAATEEEFCEVCDIFSALGVIAVLDESQMIDIVPVNGSSPAYIYRFAQAFVDYAKEKQIDENTALTLFCQSLIGSAKMMLQSGKSIEELITMVSSKGGTTLKGSEVLIENRFEEIIKEACNACAKRGYELKK